MRVWIANIEEAIDKGVKRSAILKALSEVKWATDYIAEASLDAVKLAAKSMALAVSARRALWLRQWMADTASKNTLCTLPFEGEFLFGSKLDAIITKASGGKSTFLPQEYRARRFSLQQMNRNQYKEAKAYKPGRAFPRQTTWRGGQNRLFRGSRGRGSFAKNKST
ncbi:hypothetical protein FKM82_023241 [Ascaphus truei]